MLPKCVVDKAARSLHLGLCATFLIGIVGCTDNLTRSSAEEQLKSRVSGERRYVHIRTGHRDSGNPVDYVRVKSGRAKEDMPNVFALVDAGFLTTEIVATRIPMRYHYYYGPVDHVVIKPTQKAMPFLGGVYPNGNIQCNDACDATTSEVGDVDYGGIAARPCNEGCITLSAATPTIQITGIGEPADDGGRRVSKVTYSLAWTNTPIGELLHKQYQNAERTATFVKYDNGWRIEND